MGAKAQSGWISSCGFVDDFPQESEPITYTIRKSAFTVTVPASGELEAATPTQISVPNVRTGGLKVFWIVKDGSLVRKGDTLVEFDASELLQQMEETESNLDAVTCCTSWRWSAAIDQTPLQ